MMLPGEHLKLRFTAYLLNLPEPASRSACFSSSSIFVSSALASARFCAPSSWIFTTSLMEVMMSALGSDLYEFLKLHTVFHKSVMEIYTNTYKSVIFLTLLLIIM